MCHAKRWRFSPKNTIPATKRGISWTSGGMPRLARGGWDPAFPPGLLPEREGVVAHEGLALAHQEGAILAARLGAVLVQQLLSDLPSITATSQLPVEPLLREVQLVIVELLQVHPKMGEMPSGLAFPTTPWAHPAPHTPPSAPPPPHPR